MSNMEFNNKVIKATKWASITEVLAKIIGPITNMILARILAPEVFGIVASITLITSFAEMLTDAGFHKYLIQFNFKSRKELENASSVSFCTNFLLSIIVFVIILLNANTISMWLGYSDLGNAVWVSCLLIPINSFTSIQLALYKRELDFRTVFVVRIIGVFVPVIITIPLALSGYGYWSIIVGLLLSQLISAVILYLRSSWKPKFLFDIKILKRMINFSFWSSMESISIWLTVWIDSFIIASALNMYFLGLYKTSTMLVSALLNVIVASSVPVLFSALSRLQEDTEKFTEVFLKFQRISSIIVLPLGVGIFLFSDLVTLVVLGNEWGEASKIIGVWSLTSAITIVYGYYNSEVYRAKGKPKLSFLAQAMHLFVLVPVCLISVKVGFWTLVYWRAWIRMQHVLVHFALLKMFIGIPILRVLNNTYPMLLSACIMGLLGYMLKSVSSNTLWYLVVIFLCIVLYFVVLSFFSEIKREGLGVLKKIIK
ncbi:lipopolysaccharide biosynthesis protein [Paenibacillus sp. CAU 1782]